MQLCGEAIKKHVASLDSEIKSVTMGPADLALQGGTIFGGRQKST